MSLTISFRTPLAKASSRVARPRSPLALIVLVAALQGCAAASTRYLQVETSLLAGDPKQADQIIERAQPEYGSKSSILYQMDRGMTLQLAGRYQESNALLEQADQALEELYTRRIRTETKAFLVNDTELPFEGELYEQVMVNVLKAVNYGAMGNWDEALVEGRKIDHRLNVLSDRIKEKEKYRNDAFARYLSGILYEVTGDLNNAFIAYRNAYDEYRQARPWSRTTVPSMLQADLLRATDALHLTQEHEQYRRDFASVAWRPISDTKSLAHILLISYNGRAPLKEDQFLDLPVSLEALNLVLLTKGVTAGSTNQDRRAIESALYGLNSRVVRVALPRLVPQKTQVAYSEVNISGTNGSFSAKTELVDNLGAVAEKNLSDRFAGIAIKAAARASVKYAMAEGIGRGSHAAAGKDLGPLIGLLAGGIAHMLAIASEQADTRSWRTLPDEIQITRLWAPPGDYELRVTPAGQGGSGAGSETVRAVTLKGGATTLFIDRVLR